jgi:hypothetical protein
MQCPKCKHPISDTCEHCMYCGTPLGDNAFLESVVDSDKAELAGSVQQSGTINCDVAPVNKQLEPDDIVSNDRHGVIVENIDVTSASDKDVDPIADALSMEKTVAMLAKMKGLLDKGRFDADVYERMALDTIKDYLLTLNDETRLIFVSYEIESSGFAPFLNEEMIERMRTFVMDEISQK